MRVLVGLLPRCETAPGWKNCMQLLGLLAQLIGDPRIGQLLTHSLTHLRQAVISSFTELHLTN